MTIPAGYGQVTVYMQNATTTRPACLTFGVHAGTKTGNEVNNGVKAALQLASGPKAKIAADVAFSRIVTQLGQLEGEPVTEDTPISVPCTGTNAVLPSNCALLIHKRSARGGRRGRGRLFVPWHNAEVEVGTNGQITPSALTTMQASWTAFFNELVTQGVPMQILHQPGNSDEGGPTPVTSLSLDPLVSTQRRRLGR
jgi:hypothetical protein